MRPDRRGFLLTLTVLTVSSTIVSCGDSGGASSTDSSASTETQASTSNSNTAALGKQKPNQSSAQSDQATPGPPAAAFRTSHHDDSGGGSKQFIVKGGDNSVQEFGAESGGHEFEQAAATLHGFLDARAERNWAAACVYLSNQTKHGFAQFAGSAPGKAPACAASLADLSGKVPAATLREAALADVGSLRVEGDRGFLLYRGSPKGTIYAISMTKEHGSWRVASLAGTPLN